MSRRGLFAVAAVALAMAATPALAAVPSWTTYRRDAMRSGVDPDSVAAIPPSQAWQTPPLDGDIYGQPLIYGSTVFVATENDTVYALDSATGAILWHKHLATAVDAGQLPCGGISPVVGTSRRPSASPVRR